MWLYNLCIDSREVHYLAFFQICLHITEMFMTIIQDPHLNFTPPCVKTERSKKSIRYHGAVLWNELCDHIKESTSPHSIKSNIKKYLLSCQ